MEWLDTFSTSDPEMANVTHQMNQNNGSSAAELIKCRREPNEIASTSLDNIFQEHYDIASSRDGVGWGPSNTPGAKCANSLLAEMHSRSFFSLEGISELHELIFL